MLPADFLIPNKAPKGVEFMKKRCIISALMLCLLLSGCAGRNSESGALDSRFASPDPMPGFDAQNAYMQTTAISFQETDGFFCGSGLVGNFLHYYDKGSGISGVLCADPACTHDSAACNAYVQAGATLSYYDGKLYWIAKDPQASGNDSYLWRSDLNGGNREKVKRLDQEKVIMAYQPQQYVVHRNRFYMLGQASVVEGTRTSYQVSLVSSLLDRSEEMTVLFEQSFDQGVNTILRFVGNSAYLCVITSSEGGLFDVTVTEFDLQTGDAQVVFKESGIAEALGGFWVTTQGELYLAGAREGHGYVWKLGNGDRKEAASWNGDGSAPIILDGVALRISLRDNVRYLELKSLAGEPIYDGKLFPGEIPGLDWNPNEYWFAIVGGDSDKIILNLSRMSAEGEMEDCTVMLDLQNDLNATILWSSLR